VPTGAGWFHEIKQFVIDGEAVILCVDGIADFNALHSGKQNGAVQLCAFDVLAIDGGDVRDLPLSMHKGVTWTGYSAAVRRHFSSTLLRSATSALSYSGQPATWAGGV
jgi:hypothetical protein